MHSLSPQQKHGASRSRRFVWTGWAMASIGGFWSLYGLYPALQGWNWSFLDAGYVVNLQNFQASLPSALWGSFKDSVRIGTWLAHLRVPHWHWGPSELGKYQAKPMGLMGCQSPSCRCLAWARCCLYQIFLTPPTSST